MSIPRMIVAGGAMLFGVMLLLGLAGCATAQPGASSSTIGAGATARVAMVNLSPYAWRIEFGGGSGVAARIEMVAAGATVVVTLGEGRYAVEQTRLDAGGEPEETRRLTAEFVAGRSYRWPLATLLSDGAGASAAGSRGLP